MQSASFFFVLLSVFACSFVPAETRYEPIRYFSDPVEVLMRDSEMLRTPAYNYRRSRNVNVPRRKMAKRRYSAYPPSFYTSSFNGYPLNFNRRSAYIPYADLLFSGR